MMEDDPISSRWPRASISFAAGTVGGLQHCEFSALIEHEDARLVEAELVHDQLHRSVQKLIEVGRGRDPLSHFCRGMDLARAFFHLLLKRTVESDLGLLPSG